MDITIRLEQPADYREAETVTREAFWNCYSPGCMEHYLLHVMRRSPRFVRELDFVAVADGKIVGSVVFMKAMIMGDDGNRYEGWFVGAGVGYGYSWVLGKRWNLEAEIGAGYAYSPYDSYECLECRRSLDSGTRHYWGITKAAISLIYFLK